MAIIVLKIPTGPKSWIEGECALEGYEKYVLVQRVAYDISVESEANEEGRRTVRSPKLSEMTIDRRVDMSSIDLAKYILSLRVGAMPWELYFLRNTGLADALTPGVTNAFRPQHLCYMTMTLTQPVITSHSVSVDEGDMTETVKVSATAIDWQYTAYDDLQRPLGGSNFSFDVQAGTME